MRHPLQPLPILRIALLGLLVPCVYYGAAGAAFYYRHRRAAAVAMPLRILTAPNPTGLTRLLVVAPHCDDETLGCAGLIQQTRSAGGQVRVVILTNGDAFRTAVERQTRSLRIGPQDYIRFASLRQKESRHALESLGVAAQDILFLGYPDRGLLPIWDGFWSRDALYTSQYTHRNRSPYPDTFNARAAYCGADLAADLKQILLAFRPTLITVAHPSEDHADHAAAAAFVTYVLRILSADTRQSAWASQTRLLHYLIHRGDWPLPQGAHPADPLPPPAAMMQTDTRWMRLPLTEPQTEAKIRAIGMYASQTAIMQRFLLSFARSDELYGEIAPARLPFVRQRPTLERDWLQNWDSLPPVLLDPVRDNVVRDLQGGGDIQALYACRDTNRLFLRLDMRQPVARGIAYTVHLRPFGAEERTPAAAVTLRLRASDSGRLLPGGVRVAAHGRTLEAAVPWTLLTEGTDTLHPLRLLSLRAETHIAGVEVDKSGVRLLSL